MRVTVTQEYTPSTDDIAKEIWRMDADEQLELLNKIATVGNSYDMAMQMEALRTEKNEYHLYQDACDFIKTLNGYLNEWE